IAAAYPRFASWWRRSRRAIALGSCGGQHASYPTAHCKRSALVQQQTKIGKKAAVMTIVLKKTHQCAIVAVEFGSLRLCVVALVFLTYLPAGVASQVVPGSGTHPSRFAALWSTETNHTEQELLAMVASAD